MSPRGSQQRPTLTKIDQRVPASDAQARLQERDRRLATDTRTGAQKWLGDPPPDRSALAARSGLKFPASERGTNSPVLGGKRQDKPDPPML